MEWVHKVWGKTREIINTPYYMKHELHLIEGSYCSLHYHQYRANRFIIISGSITIVEVYGPWIKHTLLNAGDVYSVPSMVVHMFAVNKRGIMYEEYFGDRNNIINADDIIRIIEGGKIDINQICDLPTNLNYKIMRV